MRAPALALLLLLGSASSAAAYNGTFFGCGGTLTTCASVTVSAQQLPNGTWRVTMTIQNLSYDSSNPSEQASGIRGWGIGGLPAGTTRIGRSNIIDENGKEYQRFFTNESGNGNFDHGVDGYVEKITNEGRVAESWTTAIVDSRCLADPACAALRPVSGNRATYIDIGGTVHFSMTLSQWTGTPEVWIRNSDFEEFQLTAVTGSTVAPEPVTMTLLATGLGFLGATALRRRRRP